MVGRSTNADVVNPLETLFGFGVVGDLSDGQLLYRFLTARDGADQAAFTALVDRHGPMVLHVCRQVMGNAHDAQDAFQATFLVLARKAGSVRKADSLASWLYGVAYRIARRARSNAVRRRLSEHQAGAMKAVAPHREENEPESWPELHEEVARLPKRYREPVVLCYLEGRSTEEAAQRIGCAQGTVFSRLSRARERLRQRLIRRGVALPAAWLGASLAPPAKAAMPPGLVPATVRASLGFAGRRAAEAAAASATATAMARGVLHAMTIFRLTTVGAAILACALAMGGAHALGWFGGPAERQMPAASEPGPDDPRAALSRSVDQLESDLDETTRRNAAMKRELQDLRARVKSLREAPEPAPRAARDPIAQLANELRPDPTRAVARLAEALRRHPPRHGAREGARHQVYMMDLVDGGTTLILDEPVPGLIFCGSPKWSHDGNRILFDATPGKAFQRSRLMAIEVRDGRPVFTDLGPGDVPTFSPDDRRIAFLLNDGAVPGAEAGVWLMKADGSDRRYVGQYGAPFWSPDGREFLINSFSDPTESLVVNLEARIGGTLKVPGFQIFSYPSWDGPGTLVSALATGQEGDAIALLDVRTPSEAKIIEVLWKRSDQLDVTPRWPVHQPSTRRYFFVGVEPGKRTLFSIQRGETGRVRQVEAQGQDDTLGDLSFSPDGRYLLFGANRPDRR